jgi:hypothetical protein
MRGPSPCVGGFVRGRRLSGFASSRVTMMTAGGGCLCRVVSRARFLLARDTGTPEKGWVCRMPCPYRGAE